MQQYSFLLLVLNICYNPNFMLCNVFWPVPCAHSYFSYSLSLLSFLMILHAVDYEIFKVFPILDLGTIL